MAPNTPGIVDDYYSKCQQNIHHCHKWHKLFSNLAYTLDSSKQNKRNESGKHYSYYEIER